MPSEERVIIRPAVEEIATTKGALERVAECAVASGLSAHERAYLLGSSTQGFAYQLGCTEMQIGMAIDDIQEQQVCSGEIVESQTVAYQERTNPQWFTSYTNGLTATESEIETAREILFPEGANV